MAAAYTTGSALGSVDLLQKLVTFLVGQGWTMLLSDVDGAGWRAHLSKSGVFANFRAYTGADTLSDVSLGSNGDATKAGILLYLGTGYDAGANWQTQAGGARADTTNRLKPGMWLRGDAVLGYHFIDDGFDHVIVEAESAAGVHNYFGFGLSVDKAGAFTWGEYYFGSAPVYNLNGTGSMPGWGVSAPPPLGMGGIPGSLGGQSRAFVRADVDAFSPEWVAFGAAVTTPGSQYIYGYTGLRGSSDVVGMDNPEQEVPHYFSLTPYTANTFNGRTVLLPVHVFTERTGGGFSLLGKIPDLFIGYGDFAAGDVYSIASDDYLAFPTHVARQCWFVRKRA